MNMGINSAKELEEIAKKPILRHSATRLIDALTQVQLVEEVVLGYQTQLLLDGQWKDPFTDKVVLEPKTAWTINDTDFKIYDAKCQAKAKENGYEIEEGQCPLLLAESEVREAKRGLIEEFEEYLPIKYVDICSDLVVYEQYITILLGIMTKSMSEDK